MCTFILGTFSYTFFSPSNYLIRMFNYITYSVNIVLNFLFKRASRACSLSLYIAYQNIGFPSIVLMLYPSTSYLALIWPSKSFSVSHLNSHKSHTVNSVFPILCLGAYPGSDIWTRGRAKFTKAFLHSFDPTTYFIISIVCRAATTEVVVLRAAMILPALSLASIQVH